MKLLDFGIAKLLAMEGPDRRAETATDSRVMTPAYASPEQVMGAAVSTATDVYALGLLLYELLCGRRAHRLESRGAAHLEQVVVHADPLPMADALTRPGPGGDAATAEAIAQARQTTPARLARQLRGDLARIAEMALRKDPDRRYATAAHLAEDLERYLDGRPVLARPHSLIYRASRFARRHRLALAAAAIVVATLVGYTVLSVRHAREMEQAAARERQEAARAREVADFVVGLFEASDPNVVQNRDAPVARMLEQGLQRADALSTQPLLQARLLNAIGRVYFNLGKFDAAADIATRALAASRLGGGEQHPDVARDYRLLGLVTGSARQAAGGGRPVPPGARHPPRRRRSHGRRNRGRPQPPGVRARAGRPARRSGALHLRIGDRASRAAAAGTRGHRDEPVDAGVRARASRDVRARPVDLYREALTMRIARLGERHPDVARARQNLATALYRVADYDESARELTQALEVVSRGLRRAPSQHRHHAEQPRHGRVEPQTVCRGGPLRHGRIRDAARTVRTAASVTLVAQANLANYLGDMGRLAESEAMLRDVLAQSAGQPKLTMSLSQPQLKANLAGMLRRQRQADRGGSDDSRRARAGDARMSAHSPRHRFSGSSAWS